MIKPLIILLYTVILTTIISTILYCAYRIGFFYGRDTAFNELEAEYQDMERQGNQDRLVALEEWNYQDDTNDSIRLPGVRVTRSSIDGAPQFTCLVRK